jgi:glycerophosphoryl diester phosphodiesterase
MKITAFGRWIRRSWKKLLLGFCAVSAGVLVIVLVHYNVPEERSKALAGLQRLLGLNQPIAGEASDDFEIIGHRGSGEGLENTRGSIGYGVDSHVDWLEIDVRQCGQTLVLFHDPAIDGWLKAIKKNEYEGERELARLDLGALRRIQGNAERKDEVPVLDDLFADYPPSGGHERWLIDIKEVGIGEKLLEILRNHGFENYRDRVILLGVFDIIAEYKDSGYTLAYAAGWSEGSNRTRLLFGHSFITERCVDLGDSLKYLALPELFLSGDLIEAVKRAKPEIRVWTYLGETPGSWRKSLAFGVSGLIVDHVEEAQQFRSSAREE